jgi:hypothetical protein
VKEFTRQPDVSDQATDLEERVRTRSIEASRAAASKIPEGEAGDCIGCGNYYKRVVNGLCGFCRDGRRPPSTLALEI